MIRLFYLKYFYSIGKDEVLTIEGKGLIYTDCSDALSSQVEIIKDDPTTVDSLYIQ